MSNNAVVSVVVPVFNAQEFLAECLESILNQTYQNLQVLVVDDGSTDGSTDICLNFVEKDPRIVYIRQENSGEAAARNTALKAATGSYLTSVDADDMISPRYVEQLVTDIENFDADISIVSYAYRISDLSNRSISAKPIPSRCFDTEGAYRELIVKQSFTCGVAGKLFRRNIIANMAFENGIRIGPDKLFFMTALANVTRVTFNPQKLYFYRQHPASAINSTFDSRQLDAIWVNNVLYNQLSIKIPTLADLFLKDKILAYARIIQDSFSTDSLEAVSIRNSTLKEFSQFKLKPILKFCTPKELMRLFSIKYCIRALSTYAIFKSIYKRNLALR